MSIATLTEDLGSYLRSLREAKHWSPRMLAGQARVSDNAIRWIEQGKTKTPEAATVRKLVEALGGDVDHAMRLLTASPPPAGYPQRVLEEVDWIRFGDLSAGPGIWEEAPYP